MDATTQEHIQKNLAQLQPLLCELEDESHLHAGHVGAKSGGGHFRLKIVSTAFHGLSKLKRHRLVYETLGELMNKKIHALSISALTPEETSTPTASF